MRKKYIVGLTDEEREELLGLARKGECKARKLKRALVLLSADEGKLDREVAGEVRVHEVTVERIRKRLVEGGLEAALSEEPRPGKAPELDGRQEATLVALACSDPPGGRARWAMRLLADRLAELTGLESISDETVRVAPKGGGCKPWRRRRRCFREVGAEFVAAMEGVLELYGEPYDPGRPAVCADEMPVQLVGEARAPQPAAPGKAARYDYEYRRNGAANPSMHSEPKAGRRQANVTDRRTKLDFAGQMRALSEEYYPQAEKIRVVMDQLNTRRPASLYEAYAPAEARRILRRLESHHTPKHAGWLNQAEIEFGVLSGQRLDRRIPDKETLEAEIGTWEAERNEAKAAVEWRFANEDARTKLRGPYPSTS